MIPADVKTAIEEVVGSEWIVAGGWAACPGLAGDCDVWVLAIDVEDHERIAKLLSTAFEATFNGGFEDLTGKKVALYDNDDYVVTKVGYINSEDYLRIHVMVTDADSQTLVDGFDVSTHAIGITPDGEVIKGVGWTPPNVPPVKLKDTSTTNARMKKIAARFGHPEPIIQEVE